MVGPGEIDLLYVADVFAVMRKVNALLGEKRAPRIHSEGRRDREGGLEISPLRQQRPTLPTPFTLSQKIPEHAAAQPRRFASPEPVRVAAGPAADEAAALETHQPLSRSARLGPGMGKRDDLGNRLISVEHQNGSPAPDVLQIAREIVLQFGNSDLCHMAILATFPCPVKL